MSLKIDDKQYGKENLEYNKTKLYKNPGNGSKTIKKSIRAKTIKNDNNNKKIKVIKKNGNTDKNDGLNELEKLYAFMKKYRNESKKISGKNLPWTHVLSYEPYGSFNIPDDRYNKFKKLYEDAIVAGHRTSIIEKHKEYGPIVIDFDFIHSKENSKRYYTNKTILNIIRLYNKIIKKYLDVKSKCMDAYVCEKKAPSLRKNEYHDGIHIVYPYICTIPSLQMLMRKEFIEEAEKIKIFKEMPLVNDLDIVFDKGVIYNVGWMMYGSTKNATSHPYYVTHIFSNANEKIFDTIIPGENMTTRNYIKHFIDVLSCRRFFSDNEKTPLRDDIDLVVVDSKINKLKEKMTDGSNKKKEISALMGENINFIKAVSQDLLVEAKNLVKMFSKKRASYRDSWYQVGKCLYNIDYRLLDDWIQFSKKTTRNNFVKGECEILWKKFKHSNYSMATLHYFAAMDNPSQYMRMKEEKLSKLIRDGMEASHNTIAKLLMEKYKFRYKCASIKHNIWYEFKNHRWVEIDSAYSLRNLISDELTQEYGKQQSYLYDLAKQKQGYDKEQCISEAGRVSKVISKLNNSTFKNGVIRECADIAYDPNFLKNLDENIYLICFENGVYDLEAENFRDGCPDDYISLCTGYDYIPYDNNDEYSRQIKDFIEKIQPEKDMRKYLLTLLSTCLAGSICEESFYVLTGSGANGKSKLMELMKYTMGDLFKPMDIMVLVGKRTSSSSATPELADKKGIRICPFDEPKATDEINTGFMKIFTGGDQITARALFKEPIYFKPQFKPFLLCNHLPNIKADDDGTWRRLKVIPFLSKFIKLSEAKKKTVLGKNQYWADNSLSEKLPEWKQMFMSMLIEYYKKYRTDGLVHPKLVTRETANYRKKCDVFQDFIGDYLEKTDDPKDCVNTIALYQNMRNWYRANYDGKGPNTKDLRTYLQHRMPTFNTRTDSLTCYKVKSTEEETMDELAKL
jgi:P4 family phage/plasmid primase-like protien